MYCSSEDDPGPTYDYDLPEALIRHPTTSDWAGSDRFVSPRAKINLLPKKVK